MNTPAEAPNAVWGEGEVTGTLYVPLRVFIYLRRPYMTKRGFRRWRAAVRKRIGK